MRAHAHALYESQEFLGPNLPGALSSCHIIQVDGMDVFAVKQAMMAAKEYCLTANAPLVIEMDTYRYHGHSMSDPGTTYRTRDEVSGIRQERDPIERLRKFIKESNAATDDELRAIEKSSRKVVGIQSNKPFFSPPPLFSFFLFSF